MRDDLYADIVLDFLRRMREERPEIPESSLLRVESSMRQDWGGVAVYVRKHAPPLEKASRLAGRLAAGASLFEATEAFAISRRTGFRLRRRYLARA